MNSDSQIAAGMVCVCVCVAPVHEGTAVGQIYALKINHALNLPD